ncbi:hypothetical protein K503DRAFT_775173 [Rhizopogon vinicolor AM-OR11-026]|uniref:Uncharacterized protein n=1 Tax=Rhizopogon vinicolor AM-OR11-026 TaxID=1314800 RepID=A0A1B7MMI4_9AGAM|nr:hypothetical protein K503DRAFT_775173 [Rhizopogon vinicolor AM-OR11-026]
MGSKLNCDPEGNHIRADISPLHKVKFQFQLCQPFKSVFAEDFDKAIQNSEGLQAKFSETADQRNMIIVSDKNVKLIRFTSNIFEQRVYYLLSVLTRHSLPLPETAHSQTRGLPLRYRKPRGGAEK